MSTTQKSEINEKCICFATFIFAAGVLFCSPWQKTTAEINNFLSHLLQIVVDP